MQPFGTILLLLLSSAALVLLGHVFRLLRWEQFIRIYEYPQRRSLLRAMAGGYAVNFLLPFHVGDFLRAALAGRKMKTGTGFAFATVIMDRFLDVWVVALLFGGFRLAGLGGAFMSMYYSQSWNVNMVAGRGFIALAAQAMGSGECLGGMLSSLIFGFAQALGIKFSAVGLDSNLASPIPYAVTIIGLVIFSLVRRSRAKKLHSAAALK